jgi:hypothetical protein
VCFVRSSEPTAINSLYSIKVRVFIARYEVYVGFRL